MQLSRREPERADGSAAVSGNQSVRLRGARNGRYGDAWRRRRLGRRRADVGRSSCGKPRWRPRASFTDWTNRMTDVIARQNESAAPSAADVPQAAAAYDATAKQKHQAKKARI